MLKDFYDVKGIENCVLIPRIHWVLGSSISSQIIIVQILFYFLNYLSPFLNQNMNEAKILK